MEEEEFKVFEGAGERGEAVEEGTGRRERGGTDFFISRSRLETQDGKKVLVQATTKILVLVSKVEKGLSQDTVLYSGMITEKLFLLN